LSNGLSAKPGLIERVGSVLAAGGALLLSLGSATAQTFPNSATALPPDPAIQICNPTPTNCFTPNRSAVQGVSDNGIAAGSNSVFIPAGLLPAVSLSTTTIHKNGQWLDLGPQINAASGVTDGFSYANAISRDGTVLAGYAPNGLFRWTFTGPGAGQGNVFLLPNPAPGNQFLISVDPILYSAVTTDALVVSGALSADGSTIVGRAFDGSHQTAFRCVGNCAAVQFLPLPGGVARPSSALGTNADGSIVVGTYDRPPPPGPVVFLVLPPVWQAFYWSAASGAVAMPNPAGLTGSSVAYATNAAGTVIVGGTEVTPGASYNGTRATIWRTAGGPAPTFTATNIHTAAMGTFSVAQAVNAAGTLVGGVAFATGGGLPNGGAWLWTQATGARLVTAILGDAGITLPAGTVLREVSGISPSGEFIGINADLPDNGGLAYLLRYIAPTITNPVTGQPEPVAPIVGITTRDSVQRSMDRLAETQMSQVVSNRILAGVLTGINEQVNCGDCGSGFASVGSVTAGLHGRRSITDSVIAFGGVAFNQARGKGYSTEGSPVFAGQVRIDPADWGPARPFLDVGGMLAPNQVTRYSRRYENGASPALGRGSSQTATAMAFARLGYVARLSKETEIAGYVELARMWQRTKGYVEPLNQANPFEATVAAGRNEMTIAKVGGQFTQLIAPTWELNLSAGVAHGFDIRTTTRAAVPGFGLVSAVRPKDTTWLEYGARLSYRVSQTFVIDGFVNGTASGSRSVGNTLHGGVGFRMSF
jgi:uncharacterized membrane protein